MFIAVSYKFSDSDKTKITAKLSGVGKELFLRYLEADLICLEEAKYTIPVGDFRYR